MKKLFLLFFAAPVAAYTQAQLQVWGDIAAALQQVSGSRSYFERYAQMPTNIASDRIRLWYTVPGDQFWRWDTERLISTRSYITNGRIYGRNVLTSLKLGQQSDQFYVRGDNRFTWTRQPILLTLPALSGFLQWSYDYSKLDGPTGFLYEPDRIDHATQYGNFKTEEYGMRYFLHARDSTIEARGSEYHFTDHSGLLPNSRSVAGEISATHELGNAGSIRLTASQVATDLLFSAGRALVNRAFRFEYVAVPADNWAFDASFGSAFNDARITKNGYSRRSSGGEIRLSYSGIPKTSLRFGLGRKEFQYISRNHDETFEPRVWQYNAALRSHPLPFVNLQVRYRDQNNEHIPPAQFNGDYSLDPLIAKRIRLLNTAAGFTLGPSTILNVSYDYERRDNPMRHTEWDTDLAMISFWSQLKQGWSLSIDVFQQKFRALEVEQIPNLTGFKGYVASLSHWVNSRIRYSTGFVAGRQDGTLTNAMNQKWFLSARQAFIGSSDIGFEINNQLYSDHREASRDYRTWGGRIGFAFTF